MVVVDEVSGQEEVPSFPLECVLVFEGETEYLGNFHIMLNRVNPTVDVAYQHPGDNFYGELYIFESSKKIQIANIHGNIIMLITIGDFNLACTPIS